MIGTDYGHNDQSTEVEALRNLRKIGTITPSQYEKITYHNSVKDALKGTDMLFISTDWEEFRGLSGTIEQMVHPPYLIMDGRRMIPDYRDLVEKGYEYIAVGSPYMHEEA